MTDPGDMEQVLRHLDGFRALHETEGIAFLTGPGGILWSLADLERMLVIAAGFPVCQASAVAALVADLPPARCLPWAVQSLCAIYDSMAIWKDGINGLRHLVSTCPGHQLEAA